MQPIPIALQLYTLRETAAKDFFGVLETVAEIGYAGVEFAGLHDTPAEEVRKKIDSLGLTATSAHGPLPTAENVGQIVETARTLGHTRPVCGFGAAAMDTEEKTRDCARQLGDALAALAGADPQMQMSIHNHYWEFDHAFAGKTPHEILMESDPKLCAEIDTYWVAVGGANPAEVVRSLHGRAPLLHIKDGPGETGKPMLPIGRGVVDWASVMQAADGSAEWLIVELDACDGDMLEAVRESYRFLTGEGYAKGNG